MEKVLNNGFCEMTQDDSMEISGGLGPIAWTFIGFGVSVLIDGVVTAATGQSCSDWVADGLEAVF